MKKLTYLVAILFLTFASCGKSELRLNNENPRLNSSKRPVHITESIKVDSLYAKALSKFKGKSSDEILLALKTSGRITENTYRKLIEYNQKRNFGDNEVSRHTLISNVEPPSDPGLPVLVEQVPDPAGLIPLLPDLTVPLPPLTPDEANDLALYTIVSDELIEQGLSFGCATAIAGVALTIAGGIVGGPVTVAAAAIWGASHIVSVLSLTSCLPTRVSTITEQYDNSSELLDNLEERMVVFQIVPNP